MNRPKNIVLLLSNATAPITGEYISKKIGVSLRTVRDDLKKSEELININGGVLRSKRGVGYWIEIENNLRFREYIYQLQIRNTVFTVSKLNLNPEEDSIMKYMISTNGYFKLDKICEYFYISRSSLDSIIKSFKEIIKNFDLELKPRSNFGVELVGNELNKRFALLYFFDFHYHNIKIENKSGLFYTYFEENPEEIKTTRNILLSKLYEHDFSLYDSKTNVLSRYLIVQKKRNKRNYRVQLDDNIILVLHELKEAKSLAIGILEALKNEFNAPYEEDEVLVLILLLSLWQDISSTTNIAERFKPIYSEIVNIIDLFIEDISEFLKMNTKIFVDFENRIKLCLSSYVAYSIFDLGLLDVRVERSHRKLETPIATTMANYFIEEIKNKYNNEFSSVKTNEISRKLNAIITTPNVTPRVKILISSAHGTYSCRNIIENLYAIINNDMIIEIRAITMSDGRYIDKDDYDFYILEDVDDVFYSYEWPYETVKNESYLTDIKLIAERITAIYNEKLANSLKEHPFKVIRKNKKINKISLKDINYAFYNNDTLIRFNKNIDYKSIEITTASLKNHPALKTIVDFNYIIKTKDDLEILNYNIKYALEG